MVGGEHTSFQTASEYEAKHEPDNTKKMANIWESKVNVNDGGKLSPTFAKNPAEVAAARGGPGAKNTTIKAGSPRSVSGGHESNPAATRQKSVKDIKTVFNGGKSASQSREELEKQVKDAVALANAAAEKEAKRVEEMRSKDAEEHRRQAKNTIAVLERQMAEMQETVDKLKSQVMA